MRRLLLPLMLASLCAATASAQAYKAPRNGFGQPDLEGVWTNASLTSLERPAQLKTRTLTEAQARVLKFAGRSRLVSEALVQAPSKSGWPKPLRGAL